MTCELILFRAELKSLDLNYLKEAKIDISELKEKSNQELRKTRL